MQFGMGVALGLVIGVAVLLVTVSRSTREGAGPRYSPVAGWLALVFGAIGATFFVLGFLGIDMFDRFAAILTLAASFSSAIISIGGLIRKDLTWQNWVAAVLGGAPTLFWVFFAAAEGLFPH